MNLGGGPGVGGGPGKPGGGKSSFSGGQPGFPGGGPPGAGPGGAGSMGPGGFSSGGYGSGAETAADAPLPKYKLIRFFDLKTEPGKSYQYRLKVLVLDPNHPADPKEDPPETTLDHTVLKRVKELNSKEKEGDKRKVFWVESEWSEPSEIVTVPPSPQHMLAAAVIPARETILQTPGVKKELSPKFAEKEPHATVVASIWDAGRAVRVATELTELLRGSMLNTVKSVDVLHPVTRQFHTIKDYKFETGSLLLDIRGGEPLPGPKSDKSEPFHTPGEFLLIDKNGNLIVGDEFDDAEESRRELFVEDTPASAEESFKGYAPGKTGDKDKEKEKKKGSKKGSVAGAPAMPGAPAGTPGSGKNKGKGGTSTPPGVGPGAPAMPGTPGSGKAGKGGRGGGK